LSTNACLLRFEFSIIAHAIGQGHKNDSCDNAMVDAPVRFEQPGKDDSECQTYNQTYGKNNQRIHSHCTIHLFCVFLSVNIPRIIVKGAGQVNPYMSLESNQSNKKEKKT
jgi:hypothetical protein